MSKSKTAIIVWSGGQDWKILFNFLKEKGYNILWISRTWNSTHWIASYSDHIINILHSDSVNSLIKELTPDELYYLAAYHHSSQDIVPSDEILFQESNKIHVEGYFNFLQAVAKYSADTKICYASSCLIYWGSESTQQNEKTLPVPNSIYAMTKLQGMHLGNRFADKYNLQIINAILYNHESEFRSPKFVSMKIIQGAINISKWLQDTITLGDLSTQVDWWYAGDYVKAMQELLQTELKWDYIISSWSLYTIQDLVEIVFRYLGLDRKKHIISDTNIINRKHGLLFGDNSKIKNDIWRVPIVWFEEMIIDMIEKNK